MLTKHEILIDSLGLLKQMPIKKRPLNLIQAFSESSIIFYRNLQCSFLKLDIKIILNMNSVCTIKDNLNKTAPSKATPASFNELL